MVGAEPWSARYSVTLSQGFAVEAGGDASLHAGEQVIFGNGAQVRADGELAVVVSAGACP